MKRIFFILIFCCYVYGLFSMNLWEMPTIIRNGLGINSNNASIAMPNGVVTIWSAFHNNHYQLFAQYQLENGQMQWNTEGLLVDTGQYQHGSQKIYKADDNSVIIIWTEYELNDEYPSPIRYHAQKLNLNGDRLWTETGIVLFEYTNSEENLCFFSDLAGGLCMIKKNYTNNNRTLDHISSEGLFLEPVDLNIPFTLTSYNNNLILDYIYTPEIGLNLAYCYNSKLNVANFDLVGNRLWNTFIDSTSSNIGYKLKLSQQSDSTFLCCFIDNDQNSFHTIKGQKLNRSGVLLWGDSAKTVYTDNGQITNLELKYENNRAYLAFSSYLGSLKLITLDGEGNMLWTNPIILESNLNIVFNSMPPSYDFVVKDNNNIYLFWIKYESVIENKLRIFGQKLDSSGTKLWEPDGRNFTIQYLASFFLKVNEVNGNIILVWDSAQGVHKTQIITNNDVNLNPNDGFIIYSGINGVVEDPKVISVNNHAFAIWKDWRKANGKSNLYCQIIDENGAPLLEQNGKIINDNDNMTYLIDIKADNQNNIIVWWFEVINYKLCSKVQKIDLQGNFFYPDEGLVVFDSTSALSSLNFSQIILENNDVYLYAEGFDSYNEFNIIIGQRISNNNLMWGTSGRVIIDKADHPLFSTENISIELSKSRLNHNLITWYEMEMEPYPSLNYQEKVMLLKLNSEGQADMNWNPLGQTVFIKDKIRYKNIQIFEVPEGYVCIAGQEIYLANTHYNQYYYQIVSHNGLLLLENAIDLNLPTNLDIYKINWNGDYLSIFWKEFNGQNEPLFIQKFIYNDLVLTAQTAEPVLLSSSSDNVEMLYNRVINLKNDIHSSNYYMFDENGNSMGAPYSVHQNEYEYFYYSEISKINNQEFFVTLSNYSFIDNTFTVSSIIKIQKVSSLSFTDVVNEELNTPLNKLYQNYPNPFNPKTKICFSLIKSQKAEIAIYNIKGQRVKTLCNEQFDKGLHSLEWDGKDHKGKDVASGVYFYRLKSDKAVLNKKMLLLK